MMRLSATDAEVWLGVRFGFCNLGAIDVWSEIQAVSHSAFPQAQGGKRCEPRPGLGAGVALDGCWNWVGITQSRAPPATHISN